MEKIKISLTDFIHFVNKVGNKKVTQVKNIKHRNLSFDYYRQFRQGIVRIHKNNLPKSSLMNILDTSTFTNEKMKENYSLMIKGYKKFWGRKHMSWVDFPKLEWSYENLVININPELGLSYYEKDKEIVHIIKLYIKKEETLKFSEKKMFLDLMYMQLPDEYKIPEVKVSLLDVKSGKLVPRNDGLIKNSDTILIESEAIEFINIWNKID